MVIGNDGDDLTSPGGTKKTAKLTQIEKQADLGGRLVEYFCVVSSIERKDEDANAKAKDQEQEFSWKTESSSYDEDDEDEFAGSHFRPTITARYPLHDHQDNPLHENLTFFCHPSGSIQLRTEQIMPKVRHKKSLVCVLYRLELALGVSRSLTIHIVLSVNRLTTLWRREDPESKFTERV
jgi:hypothetical protein